MHGSIKHIGSFGICLQALLLTFFLASASQATDYQAELVSSTECCPAKLVFTVQGPRFEEPPAVELEARIEKLSSFFVYGGRRLVVEGELRYGGSIVVIANLDTGRQEHVFWTYGHAFSPSGRYLVYETHYPRLGGFNKTLVVLYDLEKTPEENMAGIVASDRFSRTIGRPLYPRRNAREQSLLIEETSPRFSTSAFAFSPSEEDVAFFVSPRTGRNDERQPMKLVVAGLSSEQSYASLWTQVVDFNDFVSPGWAPLSVEEDFGWAGIDRLVWDEHALVAYPSSIHEGQLPANIRFRLPGSRAGQE